MARGKKGRFKRATRRAGRAVRRAGGSVRRFARSRRGRTLGLVGKTGVGIAAAAPIALSGLEAADLAVARMRQNQLGIMGTAKVAFYNFLNNLASGFGIGSIDDSIYVGKTDGTYIQVDVGPRVQAGAWFKTAVIGSTFVAWDILVSWASSKFAKVRSGVRLLGTKLTGGK